MEAVFPALVAVAAITLTYFMCIRPMRRGQCGMTPGQHAGVADSERDAEIARLRAEVAELHQSQEQSRSRSETMPGAGGVAGKART